MRVDQLYIIALSYLEKNPYRFNTQEKAKFMQGLKDFKVFKIFEIFIKKI